MDKLFLIDAYALVYRSYYAFINNPRVNSKGLNTSAIMGFCNTLNEVLTKEQPTHIGVAFDHGLASATKHTHNTRRNARKHQRTSSWRCPLSSRYLRLCASLSYKSMALRPTML